MHLPWLDAQTPFPPLNQALGLDSEAPGLLAAGGGLSVARLVGAYRRGIFPWYGEHQPVLWWSPDPRMVLKPAQFRFHRSLRKAVQHFLVRPDAALRFDHDFPAVIQACADMPREGQHGTWIVPEMVQAYVDLHRAGVAHSVEVWSGDELAGGLYGLLIGRMFYGESMFARRTDASKIALAALVGYCRSEGIEMIDCQQHTGHLASLGAATVPRAEFERHLRATVDAPTPGWAYDPAQWTTLGLTPALDAPPS
jgi:leucyl/phenylalanyl-tRNA---protein transferase